MSDELSEKLLKGPLVQLIIGAFVGSLVGSLSGLWFSACKVPEPNAFVTRTGQVFPTLGYGFDVICLLWVILALAMITVVFVLLSAVLANLLYRLHRETNAVVDSLFERATSRKKTKSKRS